MRSPAAPASIALEYRGLSTVVVRWAPPSSGASELIGGYKVRMEYFDAHGSLLTADAMEERQCGPQEMAAEFGFPESFRADGGLKACTIKVGVTSMGDDLHEGQSKAVCSTRDSLQPNVACLSSFRPALARACSEFSARRQKCNMSILILGAQHHGKSSMVNHLQRNLCGDANLPDAMETAPAGVLETTVETASLSVRFSDVDEPQFGNFYFRFADYPALNSLSTGEMKRRLDAALAEPIPDGTRRDALVNNSSRYGKPADAAILVVSLTHWVSQKSEVVAYLASFSERCKSASNEQVAFPYVVAVTKRDEFLEQHSYYDLENVLREIRESANTTKVHIITNMQEGSPWCPEVAGETFKLMTNIVTFAKHKDTGVVKDRNREKDRKKDAEEREKTEKMVMAVVAAVLAWSSSLPLSQPLLIRIADRLSL